VINIVNQTSNNAVITLEKWFSQAPSLPTNAKETLVKYMPIIALIFGIIGILLSLAGIAALMALAPLAIVTGVHGYSGGYITVIVSLASAILLFAAYSGTKAHKISGWNMLFLSEVVYLIGSLITLSILQGIISALISFYLLYQIKSYYTE
jgi:hypothetical protein